MTRRLASSKVLIAAVGVLAAAPARGASLQKVNDWGASGVPSTVSMYIYVPDRLAEKPPVLVCAHYCGGSAAAVFGQTQGGGIVRAADQHGFIMVFPQAANPDGSGRCWDVGSTRSLTRDGGGDTHAIAQMVKYTLRKYDANPERVYASGTSSGAMMTEALLALYPDVFKGGVEFAGVPAGCWAVGASGDGTWSGPCAGGSVTHTAAEWGDIARRMYPGYTGRRPRIQLWHGDADTVIRYQNHLEAIKQWTDVLGLSAAPTSTATLSYGTHRWTRQSWKDTCGVTVLDAWTEQAGEHGVPDANLNAEHTIPFLGLDQAGLVDPGVAQCGGTSSGGSSSSGASGSSSSGASGSSSSGASGGSSSGASGGSSSGTSGSSSSGTSGSSSSGASGSSSSGTSGSSSSGTSGGSSSGTSGGSSSGTSGSSSSGTSGSSSSGTSGSSSSGTSGSSSGSSGASSSGASGGGDGDSPEFHTTGGCSSVPGPGTSAPRVDPLLLALGLVMALGTRRRQCRR